MSRETPEKVAPVNKVVRSFLSKINLDDRSPPEDFRLH